MRKLALSLSVGGALLLSSQVRAQDQAIVEELAPLLAAEDERRWQPELFQRALVAPDSLVRRVAATAAGRIGDLRATPLLLPLLSQPDSTVRVAAAFALGLLADTAALGPLIARLTGLPALDTATANEAITAIAKIGGRRSADFFASVLQGKTALSQENPAPAISQILLESWRLGPAASTNALLPFADDTLRAVRWRAVYSLARLRAPGAANQLIAALRADDPGVRASAARALNREYAVSANLAPSSVTGLLTRATDDQDAGVRVNALRSLGTFRDAKLVGVIASRVDDPDLNVRVQAVSSLGELRQSAAIPVLMKALRSESFPVRREALLGVARLDPGMFTRTAAPWRSSKDWRERATAAEGWALVGAKSTPWFAEERDGRVIAAGLQTWADVMQGRNDRGIVESARSFIAHPDAAVRSVAADILSNAADPADLTLLTGMYVRTGRDSFPDAALSALKAVVGIRRRGGSSAERVDQEFLGTVPRPLNYQVRRWAEANWPQAAERWGPAYPLTTGRTLQDYRDLARQFLLAPDSLARPHVFIETEQRGTLEVELFGPEAPLTVANFLRLVDRRFFDGNRWHRVVPNFVVQDGDPRGDGYGGPGGAIRDEINRARYGIKPMMGMALSGPDTGSSQWFINLTPLPHLDGTYTIFGRAVGNTAALTRITQGDVIRTIRR